MVKTEYRITRSRLFVLLAGVFLVSSSLLAFEIALARLMSVMLSYHYVFALVSLSLFGIGAGGICVHFFQIRVSDKPPSPRKSPSFGSLAVFAGFCSFAMTFSTIAAIQVGHMDTLNTNILLYCIIFFFPFFFGGMFLSKVFRIFPSLSSVIYGSDLTGAAVGCLGVVLALNIFSAICAIFLFAAITAISSVILSFANEHV
jgi:hypothetical protein